MVRLTVEQVRLLDMGPTRPNSRHTLDALEQRSAAMAATLTIVLAKLLLQ